MFTSIDVFFPVENKTRNNTETAWNSCLNLFDDSSQWTVAARHMEFDIEINYRHAYTVDVKVRLSL